MKARKTMKNQPLIQEVISQISQRFAPKIPDIKKVSYCIHIIAVPLLTCHAGDRYFVGKGIYRACRRGKGHICLCRINHISAAVPLPLSFPSCAATYGIACVVYIIHCSLVGLGVVIKFPHVLWQCHGLPS
jgi:hypothetical protein